MKSLSMPISSPSRALAAEKFAPPFMRFLKSDVGSRSSNRPRASPVLRGKNNAVGMIETGQEPSSPKVTCFGQVSARHSAKAKVKTAANRRPWWRHKKALSCGRVSYRFGRCVFFYKSCYCKKVDAREHSYVAHSNQRCHENEHRNESNGSDEKKGDKSCSSDSEVVYGAEENLGDGIQESKGDFVFCPPKNALILTRCRSAPYGSSYLEARIWGSSLESAGAEVVKTEDEVTTSEQESQGCQNPCSENVGDESRIRPENIRKLKTENTNTDKDQDLKGTEGGAGVHPLLLTRCKSEPARTGERLNQDGRFRRQSLCE